MTNIRVLLCTTLVNLVLFPINAQITENFVVTDEIMSRKPISPLLYSNFIELVYGIQVEPIWGEMLWNRRFEKFVPYKEINISWYNLWNGHTDPGKGY